MKELLHSRLFRKNLKKWLFMYVGTICLLTSVITYSKYISAFNGSDKARPAKFNVKVTFDETFVGTKCISSSVSSTSSSCNLGSSRPLPSYDFEFNVDTSELEVKTLLVLTLKTEENKGFTLPDKIQELKNDVWSDVNLATTNEGKIITLTIDANNDNPIKHYKATLAYDNTGETKFNDAKDNIVGLSVGYSATQID